MALFDRLRFALGINRDLGDTPNNIVPARTQSTQGSYQVSAQTALKSSAVWASVRTRSDMVSTMPLQSKRVNPDGSITVVDTPQLQLDTIGGPLSLEEWLYSSQTDLDMTGNFIGIIRARDPLSQRPTWIEPQAAAGVTVAMQSGQLVYKIAGKTWGAADIWHERQFTISGLPVGMNAVAAAAMSIGQNMSALDFGLKYFNNPGLPTVHLKSDQKTLNAPAAKVIKDRYLETVRDRGPFVSGQDWSIDIKNISADESQFLKTIDASAADIARYFGVPSELIGVATSGSSVTYANVTQRFMGFLVLNLQPALVRRERKFTRDLLPNKVFAEFDTSELLRLDPSSEASMHATLVGARLYAPDEIRHLRGDAPMTPEQLEQIKNLIAIAPLAPAAIGKLPDKSED